MDKSPIEEEQKKNMTFCQFANKWKLIHPCISTVNDTALKYVGSAV